MKKQGGLLKVFRYARCPWSHSRAENSGSLWTSSAVPAWWVKRGELSSAEERCCWDTRTVKFISWTCPVQWWRLYSHSCALWTLKHFQQNSASPKRTPEPVSSCSISSPKLSILDSDLSGFISYFIDVCVFHMDKILQYVAFSDRLLSPSIMFSRFICAVTCIWTRLPCIGIPLSFYPQAS